MISQVETVAGNALVYQLKVVLVGAKPPIWRRLQVPADATLGWLHAVLQLAMGWTNSHLHHFLIGHARFSDPQITEDMGFGDEPDRNENKTSLLQAVSGQGAQFVYEYDFGDSWHHSIEVERVLQGKDLPATTAVCLEGARACPPQDCGGIWGYDNLLKIIKNRKHPEHKEMMEWLGRSFNPEFFDRELTNACLQKLKWPRPTEAHLRKVLMGRDGL